MDNETTTERDAGGVAVKFRGKSGKFTIFSKSMGETDPNKITFQVAELREVDADGNEVGQKAKPKHQFSNFARTDFNFTFQETVQVGTASGSQVSFSSDVLGLGVLVVDTFIITQAGEVGPNLDDPLSARWNTSVGDLKFNLALQDWKWCGDGASCTNKNKAETGHFIDVDIELKGQKAQAETKTGKGGGSGKRASKSFDLGGGVDMDLSPEVMLDGVNNTMPEGYPKLTIKGAKQIFTFRFPKFSKNATYDPVLGTSGSESLSSDTTSAPTDSSTAPESSSTSTPTFLGGVGRSTAAMAVFIAMISVCRQ